MTTLDRVALYLRVPRRPRVTPRATTRRRQQPRPPHEPHAHRHCYERYDINDHTYVCRCGARGATAGMERTLVALDLHAGEW